MSKSKVVDLKGVDFERAAIAQEAMRQDGNDPNRPAAMQRIVSCQERVDTKALTGRGARTSLRQIEHDLDSLAAHMRELSDTSKALAGAELYLMLHRRTGDDYIFLRWRERGGADRHLQWEEAQALYERYRPELRDWYRQLSEMALHDNATHLELRKQAIKLRHLIAESPGMPLFPRPRASMST